MAERVLQIVQREAVTADIDDARRRTGDRQRAGAGIEPAGVAAVDQAGAADGEMGTPPRSAPGGKLLCGTIGPRSATVLFSRQ